MLLQRQNFLPSCLKTLSVGPAGASSPRPPAQQNGALPAELTRRRYGLNFIPVNKNTKLHIQLQVELNLFNATTFEP